MIDLFQKLGGRIAPSIQIDTHATTSFQLRSVSSSSSVKSSDSSLVPSISSFWTFPSLEGSRARGGPELVIPVCEDGLSRSQIGYQALRSMRSKLTASLSSSSNGRLFDVGAPFGMMHGMDPFVLPSLNYTEVGTYVSEHSEL